MAKTLTTDHPTWGTKEFYEAKAANVEQWLAEYFDLMFPSDEVMAEISQAQAERNVHTGRVRATWIIDKMIEMQLTGRMVKLIAEHETVA